MAAICGDDQLIDFNRENGVPAARTADDILRVKLGGRETWEMEVRLALLRHPRRRRTKLIKQVLNLIREAK